MQSYPNTAPKLKHDLVDLNNFINNEPSPHLLPRLSSLGDTPKPSVPATSSSSSRSLCSFYTYADAPSLPWPLPSKVSIIGLLANDLCFPLSAQEEAPLQSVRNNSTTIQSDGTAAHPPKV